MKAHLEIGVGNDFRLPAEWMLLTTVVYGAKGSGKTTLGAVVAEEVHRIGQRFVAVDLKGDWWGLRSSADGKSPGIPVVIFGGDHADVPLEPDAGAFLGETVAGLTQSCILDLEHLSKGKQVRFLRDFFEALYHHNREPLLCLLDESQRYAPQKPMNPESTQCLGAVEDLVKLGRKHGLGVVLFTQRGSSTAKEVSELCDVLVVFRTPGPLDQNRVSDWLGTAVTSEDLKKVMAPGHLAGLETGVGIFVSAYPRLLHPRVQEVVIRQRRTFDSSATPGLGKSRTKVSVLAEPDLAVLREKMSAAIERRKAEDPRALRTEIAELKQKLLVAQQQVKVVRYERPVILDKQVDKFNEIQEALSGAVADLAMTVQKAVIEIGAEKPVPKPMTEPEKQRARVLIDEEERLGGFPVVAHGLHKEDALLAKQIRMVAAVTSFGSISRRRLALLCGMSEGGTFNTYLSKLTQLGYLTRTPSGEISVVDSKKNGIAGHVVPRGQLVEEWRAKFFGGARRMFEALMERDMTREELQKAAGMSEGGTFNTYLSQLKTRGVVEVEGRLVKLAEDLR